MPATGLSMLLLTLVESGAGVVEIELTYHMSEYLTVANQAKDVLNVFCFSTPTEMSSK